MPKNKGKGGRKWKRGKTRDHGDDVVRPLTIKEPGQEYAQAVAMLGNGRVSLKCFDGKERLGLIRGRMRKRNWISCGDVLLVGLRDFQDSRADILDKYSAGEVAHLKAMHELPPTVSVEQEPSHASVTSAAGPPDLGFDFDGI